MYWILAFGLFAGSASAQFQRIVGGEPTTIEKYPSIVQVDYLNSANGVWFQNCAGNILTTRSILSAAHCFHGRNYGPHLRRIRAGATYRNTEGQVNYVLIAFNHPTWAESRHRDADITVVRLILPLVYNPVVAQTTIPPQGTIIPDDLPVVYAGWGVTIEGGYYSEVLRHVTVYTVNNDLCAELYNQRVNKDMICAGILGIGGKDACQADSGGPLYYGNITIGIVAFGDGCARPQSPGVNTAVASFTDWIASNTI